MIDLNPVNEYDIFLIVDHPKTMTVEVNQADNETTPTNLSFQFIK